jgi:hypothetical protein
MTCAALPIGANAASVPLIFSVDETINAVALFAQPQPMCSNLCFYATIQVARAQHFSLSMTCLTFPFLMLITAIMEYWLKMAWLS